ncbi:MAG: ribonuclease III [Ruminococcaceae bacterium]|nr:ribonuclease III [Oscillospiraceae bacterium]MBR3595579.1 ribonuclease III [Clostridia bacterium]
MFPDETEINRLFTDADPKGLSGLSLAFIGDAVYELLIRRYILSKGEAKVSTLHKEAVKLVNADYQADMTEILMPLLTEEEISVFKRGRNAHSAHTPKNKSEAQYHKSTGFEALIGYLYLKKDTVRLNEIFSVILLQGEENE